MRLRPVSGVLSRLTTTPSEPREKTMDSNHILDRLDAEAKRDILHAEQFEKFQLGPPTYLPDDLDEATTNDSIEIEIIEE